MGERGVNETRKFNHCIYCQDIEPEVGDVLKRCPQCKRDLIEPEETPEDVSVDGLHAHPTEAQYARAALQDVQADEPLVLDAHEVIDYAHSLVAVAQYYLDVVEVSPAKTALLGFMTGSSDLLTITRRLLGDLLMDRIAFVPGLKHKSHKADTGPKDSFERQLNDWIADGVETIVIVDELVSGGQLRQMLRALADWSGPRIESAQVEVHVVGLCTSSEASAPESLFEEKVLRGNKDVKRVRCSLKHKAIGSPLLAKDTTGKPIKDTWNEGVADYVPWRELRWNLRVECPRPGSHAFGKAPSRPVIDVCPTGSAGSVFGALIMDLAGLQPGHWASIVKQDGCPECRGALLQLRGSSEKVKADLAGLRRALDLRRELSLGAEEEQTS